MSSSFFEHNTDLKALEHELERSNFFEIEHLVNNFTKRVKWDSWCNTICGIVPQMDKEVKWNDFVPILTIPFYHAYRSHLVVVNPMNAEVYQKFWSFLDPSGDLYRNLFSYSSKDGVTPEIKPETPFDLFEKEFNKLPDAVRHELASNDLHSRTIFNSDVEDLRYVLKGVALTAGENLRLLNLHRMHIK